MDTLPKVKQTYLNKQNRIIDYTLIKQLHVQRTEYIKICLL